MSETTLIREIERRLARRDTNRRYYQTNKTRRRPTDDHPILFNVRLAPTLIGRLHRLVTEGVSTGRFPWRTISACVTELLRRGIETLKGDEVIDEMLPHLELMRQVDTITQQRREAQVILDKAKQEIGEMLAIKEYSAAIQLYHVTLDAAHKLPPTVYRNWLMAKLTEAFPELAKRAPAGIRPVVAKPHAVPGRKLKFRGKDRRRVS